MGTEQGNKLRISMYTPKNIEKIRLFKSRHTYLVFSITVMKPSAFL